MKRAAKGFFLLAALGAMVAYAPANNTNGKIQHIIVIVQENRTPDNLFGSNPTFESGVNIRNYGFQGTRQINFPAPGVPLGGCYDNGHGHLDFLHAYDSGANDNFDAERFKGTANCTTTQWPDPPYYFVDNDIIEKRIQPYMDIAKEFGFANYMFQTNQGPSFPAHQFLFSDTSAPDQYNTNDTYYKWFASENPQLNGTGVPSPTGCAGTITGSQPETVQDINPNGGESNAYTPPVSSFS